ncbi:MAG: NAD-dependent epimerase/dehydratase family protein, partial [Haloarculaceae archaeon]
MALETVAVLGGTGFVGTRVVERLSRRGYEVVAVDQADGEVVADALDAG